jgi:SAM-dependent methyltransferase
MTTPQWHDRRLSFGGWADQYDRSRPGYPADAVRWLVDGAQDGVPSRVLDLGAGTGRLAVAVASLGHDVIAVEPDEGMRSVAEGRLPGRTRVGSAESIPLEDASVDTVLAGQAYHWFDPERAIPEIARVLRPGGRLGIVWNIRDERVDWVAALLEIVGGEDRMSSMKEPAPELGEYFGRVEHALFTHEQELDTDGLVALAGSWSYVALRNDRDEVFQAIRDLAATHPGLAGRDSFALPYVTNTFRAHRRLPPPR